jgi:ribonucleoside-diphosphate reductase alpha chain
MEQFLEKNTTDVEIVLNLQKENIYMTDKAKDILNNSTHLKEMGLIIFLDRYSLKDRRGSFEKGDLVVAVSKDHPKYPKKDLGIIVDIDDDSKKLKLRMITGVYADTKDLLVVSSLKADKPLESIYDAYQRVAKAAASVEGDNAKKYQELFVKELLSGHIQPAGRIMAGANVDEEGKYTSNLTLYNCYVIPSPKDSRASIVKDTLYQMVEIMSRGGGVGINLSTLRPRYAHVQGVNGKSSGSVSWGNLYSNATGLIEQGGSRRGALMLMLSDWHPDVEEFISAKHQIGFLDNANLSVLVSNELMEAVKKDGDWNLEFPDLDDPETKKLYNEYWDGNLLRWKEKGYKTRIYKTLKARELWHKLVHSAWKSAEPGIVFGGRYNDLSNSYYYNDLVATNPCGEQGLPPWGVCNLGHLALNNFVIKSGDDETGPLYQLDWDALKNATKLLVRFLDNIIDLTPYIFEENKKNQLSERRVGAGTLGLAELLIRLRLPFGSKEATEFIDELYKTITITAYEESIELAKEKGSFPYFEADKYLQSGFVKTLPIEIRDKIKEYGIRNVTLTTQAPTGTVGSMLGTSTGIEPFFAFKYFQQSRLGFHEVDIDLVKEYKKKEDGSLQDFFVSAMDLTPEQHVEVQGTIQRWTDSSISKTANVPADFTVEDTMKLYEYAYDLGCKGMTIYRDGSRDEQILSTDKSTEEKNLEAKGNNAVPESVEKEEVIHTTNEEKQLVEENHEQQEQTKELAVEDSTEEEKENVVYGPELGNTCPVCKKGIMVKRGGCTECSAGCGFTGGCDMH